MIGTEWTLVGLVRRCELNGRVVRVEGMRNNRYIVKFVNNGDKPILVNPANLASVNDPAITGNMLREAVAHLESTTTDERLRRAARLFKSGDHAEALSAAGKWTLDELKRSETASCAV